MGNLKKKAKEFWANHKYTIMAVASVLGIVTLTVIATKQKDISEEPEVLLTTGTDDTFLPESYDELLPKATELHEQTFEEKQADPNRKLPCGGWMLTNDLACGSKSSDDGFSECIVNDVPLDSMGQFGMDIIEKAREAGMEERGWSNMENALASVWVTIETCEKGEEDAA